MQTCEEHSGCVVVYDDQRRNTSCPLCKIQEEKETLETRVESLQTELNAANDEISSLVQQLPKE